MFCSMFLVKLHLDNNKIETIQKDSFNKLNCLHEITIFDNQVEDSYGDSILLSNG
jgi:Leucine-rich repeat (LRR) protein